MKSMKYDFIWPFQDPVIGNNQVLPAKLTNMSPEHQWLVQMTLSYLKVVPLKRGRIPSLTRGCSQWLM